MLDGPRSVRGERARPATSGMCRQDIRLQRIAHHLLRPGPSAVTGEDSLIGHPALVAHDFHGSEEFSQSGLRELSFLVKEIALGDENQSIVSSQASSVSATNGRGSTGWLSMSLPLQGCRAPRKDGTNCRPSLQLRFRSSTALKPLMPNIRAAGSACSASRIPGLTSPAST